MTGNGEDWRRHSIAGFRELAERRLPRFVFDFIDGGSGSETTLLENRSGLDRIRIVGSAPHDMSLCTQETRLFGRTAAMPVIIGPTGLAGAVRPRGDLALARAASSFGIPFVMSSAATVSMEELAATADGPKWFQLYIFRDRTVTARLIERAGALGFEALEVTVDNAIPGRRLRDVRNGFTLPFRWTAGKAMSLLAHPAWSLDIVRHGVPRLEVMASELDLAASDTIAELMQAQLDPSVGWDDIRWVRDAWKGPLIIKGMLDPSQVDHAVNAGVDGLVISNHGGRQIDGAVATIDILPDFVAAAAGRLTILIDSGFRTGSDIARALALGADGVQLGRATLYALAAGGEVDVLKALTVLQDELRVVQMLTGARTPGDFDSAMLRGPRTAAVAPAARKLAVASARLTGS